MKKLIVVIIIFTLVIISSVYSAKEDTCFALEQDDQTLYFESNEDLKLFQTVDNSILYEVVDTAIGSAKEYSNVWVDYDTNIDDGSMSKVLNYHIPDDTVISGTISGKIEAIKYTLNIMGSLKETELLADSSRLSRVGIWVSYTVQMHHADIYNQTTGELFDSLDYAVIEKSAPIVAACYFEGKGLCEEIYKY